MVNNDIITVNNTILNDTLISNDDLIQYDII